MLSHGPPFQQINQNSTIIFIYLFISAIWSNSDLSIIHVHSLTNNPNSKHRSICLNLTFEISHKESSKDKKNEIMLRLTFEGLADQIRIQHWQGRNFICRSGWILLNTPNKNDLDFLMLWCKGRELATSGFCAKRIYVQM